jgi:uncharacterized protein (TIGR02271 family)
MVNMQALQDIMEQSGNVVDREGEKIGKIGQVYLDDQTNEPEWVTASTGLFGTSESFVPLKGAAVRGNEVAVTYSKDMIKDAPRVEADGHLSGSQESELYDYYGLDYAGVGNAAAGTGGAPEAGTGPGHDTSGPNTDAAMTRSEEELHVGTERQETGRARLRKHVVTENVQTTVPVSHEEVRVEREPITDANRDEARSGPAFNEEEHEVTLHEERPVVEKEEKPVERVRLTKDEVRDEAEIDETVRKEQIDTDGDDSRR